MSTTCNNNHLSPEQRLRNIFTKDADGNVAIRTVNVVGGSDDAVFCGDTRTFIQLLAAAIGTNEDGKPALRLAQPE